MEDIGVDFPATRVLPDSRGPRPANFPVNAVIDRCTGGVDDPPVGTIDAESEVNGASLHLLYRDGHSILPYNSVTFLPKSLERFFQLASRRSRCDSSDDIRRVDSGIASESICQRPISGIRVDSRLYLLLIHRTQSSWERLDGDVGVRHRL